MRTREPEFITYKKNTLTINCSQGFDSKEERIKLNELLKFLQKNNSKNIIHVNLVNATHSIFALVEKYCKDVERLSIHSWKGESPELYVNLKEITHLIIQGVNFEKVTFKTLRRLKKLSLTDLPNLKYFANIGLGILEPTAWECPYLEGLELRNTPKLITMLNIKYGKSLHLEGDFNLSKELWNTKAKDKLQIFSEDLGSPGNFFIYRHFELQKKKSMSYYYVKQEEKDPYTITLQSSSHVAASKLTTEQCETMRILSNFNQEEGLTAIQMLSLLKKYSTDLPALQRLIHLTASSSDKQRLMDKLCELVMTEADLFLFSGEAKNMDKQNIKKHVLQQLNHVTESLTKLEKSISSISSLPDLPETKAEQEVIDTHSKNVELKKYQKKLEERLSHLILGSFVLATQFIETKPSQAQQATHFVSTALGLAPFIGSALRSAAEAITMGVDFALETIKIRQHTQIANIFHNPEQMRWIVRQLARKLTLAHTTDLITTEISIIKKMELEAIGLNSRKSGLGKLTSIELLAYYDAGKILENATKHMDEIQKVSEDDYPTYLLDQLLKNMLGTQYEKSLQKSLRLVIKTSSPTPSSQMESSSRNVVPQTGSSALVSRSEVEELKKKLAEQQVEIEKLKSKTTDHSHDVSSSNQMQVFATSDMPMPSGELITPSQMMQMFHELTMMQRQTQETQLVLASQLEQVSAERDEAFRRIENLEKEKGIHSRVIKNGTPSQTLFRSP